VADQTPAQSPESALLVPVGESRTLRNTVAYAVETASEAGLDGIHFVAPVPWHDITDVEPAVQEATQALLERVATWASEDDPDGSLTVVTTIIGDDEYLFAPDDYAEVLASYATEHGIDRLIFDPEYSPGGNVPILRPMEVEITRRGFSVEEAPFRRSIRRGQLLRRGGALQFATLFGISFLFYQLLGGFALTRFDLLTGAASATIVAVMLYRITFADRLRLPTLARRLFRLSLFVPYLVYEIVKSNVLVSYVILHPDLPIEPRMTEVRTAVWGGMPVTTLANSITLTPGTLTVRVTGRDFAVHTLTAAAREGLFDGSLERAVRFVFYGRAAMGSATPRERGDCRIVDDTEREEE
jgi:multicomponent Na+:H+ antiporter subunit E